jgi:hypothetical protein
MKDDIQHVTINVPINVAQIMLITLQRVLQCRAALGIGNRHVPLIKTATAVLSNALGNDINIMCPLTGLMKQTILSLYNNDEVPMLPGTRDGLRKRRIITVRGHLTVYGKKIALDLLKTPVEP